MTGGVNIMVTGEVEEVQKHKMEKAGRSLLCRFSVTASSPERRTLSSTVMTMPKPSPNYVRLELDSKCLRSHPANIPL